jgi:hypothetical protein
VKIYGYGTNIPIYQTGIGVVPKREKISKYIYDIAKESFEKGIKNA